MDGRGNCSRSKLEQETITTHLLYIPGDSLGEFWNGKVEGVIANSNNFCCLPAVSVPLLAGGFPAAFVFVTLLSIHTPTGIRRLFSLVLKESPLTYTKRLCQGLAFLVNVGLWVDWLY